MVVEPVKRFLPVFIVSGLQAPVAGAELFDERRSSISAINCTKFCGHKLLLHDSIVS
jgi:hypothetical protein